MPSQRLSVTVPPRVLTQIRKRARNAKRTVEDEIISLLADAVANGTPSSNGAVTPGASTRSEETRDVHRLLAEAEAKLAPETKEAIDRIEKLDDKALRKAVKPILRPKQAKRLEALNRKAQDEGLTGASARPTQSLATPSGSLTHVGTTGATIFGGSTTVCSSRGPRKLAGQRFARSSSIFHRNE